MKVVFDRRSLPMAVSRVDDRLRRRRRVRTVVHDGSLRSTRMVRVMSVVAMLTVNMNAAARNGPQDQDSQERGPEVARNAWHNVSLPVFSRAPEKPTMAAIDTANRAPRWHR